ncbi:hypothetical protein TPHA_0D04370 [Tetrapisispora phaffii CBS 4417]|uniref:Uncharacterized protein n=1 Tax=Tetrapisispora phaffii (strain ATCC 24235 / CBS 4417 / NBRC 1672 / NRRL Y-8282 / UCD 70-5) TaxID=1071381 RepID=G8BRZ6_TETPH|nr:hypothetical protein TPHA_0D04370 [Tetrapisispora phaffii CBS 4417]CCE63071.1 hypothetical protein TPHA_0D04370 [Tetrapisispora phaffii CBS 4417]
MSEDLRSQLYVQCLNREFDAALENFKSIPVNEMDYSLLKLYMNNSCQWGHFPSIQYIWYKYVMRNQALLIEPSLLCDMANMCVAENQSFMPNQIYMYYKKYYYKDQLSQSLPNNSQIEYELLKAKVESFAKTSKVGTLFQEKWYLFVKEMDNYLSPQVIFKVRDFPLLTESLRDLNIADLKQLLFTNGNIDIKNNSTPALLLNMSLLQPNEIFDDQIKFQLFKRFKEEFPALSLTDSVKILHHKFKDNMYLIQQLKMHAPSDDWVKIINE